jgi:hypothetical protein
MMRTIAEIGSAAVMAITSFHAPARGAGWCKITDRAS